MSLRVTGSEVQEKEQRMLDRENGRRTEFLLTLCFSKVIFPAVL